MLTTFIIIASVMTLIAIFAVCKPLWFGAKDDDTQRRETTMAILRQQAKELEDDHVAGRIDNDEYEESRMELERRVIDETRHEDRLERTQTSPLARVLAVVFAIVIPASAVLGYLAFGRYTAMDEHFLQMMANQQKTQSGHSATEMNQRIRDLKAELEAAPHNPEGWFMLARMTASVNRFDESVAAYKKLCELVPNNADIIADMADMMAAASGKVITPEVKKTLEKALALDPNQWKALALLAINAWDKEQYAERARLWEHLLEVVPPDFPDIDQIRANINEAKRLGGINDNISKLNSKDRGATTQKDETPLEAVPTVSAATTAFVAGTVQLSPELKAKASPDDTVFIYARPAEGSRMPLAFMKVKVKDLPYNFRLDETMTMAMGAETLASHKTVIVGARVSKTGNFMPQAGDLEGEMQNAVEVGDSGLIVMIGKVR